MKKIAFLLLIGLIGLYSFAQDEASNWYFGSNAGLRFNPDGSTTNLTDGRLNTVEGCATISDSNGNLLFYTDGITVWNKLHNPMPNGFGLYGDPSSSQSAIVVPKPDDPNIYYIFTVDTSNGQNDPDRGFNFSTVDMTLNGGLGDVISSSKNYNLLQDSSEKISAVLKDCKTKSIWVITLASATGTAQANPIFNTFYAYEVSIIGVDTTPVKSPVNTAIADPRGYLKLSPDGTKLVCANASSGLYLFDFDTASGMVSNQTVLNINFNPGGKPQVPYGVEFSQNNELLYVTAYYETPSEEFNTPSSQYGSLLQYDLTAPNINTSQTVIDHRQMYRGALQLAPNGKIYQAMNATYQLGSPYLSVISNPNNRGPACNYKHNAVALSRSSRQGLPPFITSFFAEKINITQKTVNITFLPLCNGESYTLAADDIPSATYTWTKDGIPLPNPGNNYFLEIMDASDSGAYKVTVETIDGDCNVLEGEALVNYFVPPMANPISNIAICNNDNSGVYAFDLTSRDREILGSQDPRHYEVKYYSSQEDANLNKNEITTLFNATSSPQTIYTRVGLKENDTCFDTSVSFTIQVYLTPTISTFKDLMVCDSETPSDPDTSNGLTNIDLHLLDGDILGTQNPSDHTITYHNNPDDANNRNGALNYNYTNQTAFDETIYARIENKLHTDCYSVSGPIHLIVNPLPTFTNTILIQCDEDGIKDDITIFNLMEAKEVLTNKLPDRSLKFFTDPYKAENSIDPIPNPEAYPNTSNPQLLYVQVIDNTTGSLGCFSIAELTLEVSTTQMADYVAPEVCDELGSEDGINEFNLSDIEADMQTINGFTYPIAFYETYNDALLEQKALGQYYTNTTPYSQTIYARAENNNACYGICKVLLTVNQLPDIETEALDYYCLNTFPQKITLNAAVLNDSSGNYTYNWSTGEDTYEIQINNVGTYSVTVTNTNLCSKERTITVEPSNIATFNTTPFEVNDASTNNTVTIFVSGEGTYQYALYDQYNQTVYRDYQDSDRFENVFPGIYTVNVKDIKNNCETVHQQVSVIGFPKFFTPNNDGVHDTWQVYGISGMFQPNSKILIFDRLGKLIKELDPLGEGWDGTFNGKTMPTDDYWFAVTLQDGRIFKNHFTLKR